MQPKGGGRVFVWAYMLDNRYIDERLYVVLVLLVNAPFASALPQLQCSAPCSIRAEFNRPPFFCRAFSGTARANSCVRQLRGLLLSRFRPYTVGFPPRKQP